MISEKMGSAPGTSFFGVNPGDSHFVPGIRVDVSLIEDTARCPDRYFMPSRHNCGIRAVRRYARELYVTSFLVDLFKTRFG